MSNDDFVIISKLGEGTYGQVFKVKRLSDNEQYAMKRVKIMDLKKDKDRRNTLNEIRILASIDHPNIIQYKQAFFDQKTNKLCTIMQLAPGGDMANKIKSKFNRGEEFYQYQIWKYGLNILEGLKHLHALNIIHRDLKPANIFFGKNDVLKLGDMNVSALLHSDLAHTQTGTPNYASPQIWNNQSYSFECDIWSFGCLMYEMCCFRSPFRSKSIEQLYQKVKLGVYDKIPKRYSVMLEDVIARCLQKKESRINISELIEIFQKHSFVKSIKASNSTLNLLETIHFPKDKRQFSNILPSPKYSKKSIQKLTQGNPESPKEKIHPNRSCLLDKYIKEPPTSLIERRRLNNQVYYKDDKAIKSEKLLPNISSVSSVEKPLVTKYEGKNISFNEILKSLQDVKISNKQNPLERIKMRKRNLRIELKL